jgi:hypothetical protein
VLEPRGRGVLDAPLSRGMTTEEDKGQRSRGTHASELFDMNRPQKQRGRRECRVSDGPAAACATKSTGVSNHRFTGNIRHSLRNGFNGVLRALPGDRALLPPSSVGRTTNLTPASGRQNHTTFPSAIALFVCATNCAQRYRVHRIPLPTSVTIASRPSYRCGMHE